MSEPAYPIVALFYLQCGQVMRAVMSEGDAKRLSENWPPRESAVRFHTPSGGVMMITPSAVEAVVVERAG